MHRSRAHALVQILDTRMYEVKYLDGHNEAFLAANAITVNMFAQVDNKGNQHVLFKEEMIADHQTVGSVIVKQQEAFITSHQEWNQIPKRDNKGMGNPCPMEG